MGSGIEKECFVFPRRGGERSRGLYDGWSGNINTHDGEGNLKKIRARAKYETFS